MVVNRRSFTVKADIILRKLETPCFVSVAAANGRVSGPPPSIQFRSIWDTGATVSMVSNRVVEALGLPVEGLINIRHAGGEALGVPTFRVDLLLYNNVQLEGVRVGLVHVREIDVIIGMDIINRGDFAVSNRNGATSFSFRIPSIADFDFVKDDEAEGL